MRVDGACHCGNVAFEAEADPETCADLSLHRLPNDERIAVPRQHSGRRRNVPAGSGSPKIYIKTADSGAKAGAGVLSGMRHSLYATSPTNPTSYGLRVGTIAQRAKFRPARQIWCQSELPWTAEVGGVERRDGTGAQ